MSDRAGTISWYARAEEIDTGGPHRHFVTFVDPHPWSMKREAYIKGWIAIQYSCDPVLSSSGGSTGTDVTTYTWYVGEVEE